MIEAISAVTLGTHEMPRRAGSFSRGNSQREAVLEKSQNSAVATGSGSAKPHFRPKLLGGAFFFVHPVVCPSSPARLPF